MKFLPLTFIWLFCSSLLLAQAPLDFFPHHLGDIWEYWVDAGPGGLITKQNEITKDSLGNNGRYYLETSWFGKFVVDTTTFEVFKLYGTLDKLYKLDADSGDSWIVWEDSTSQFQFIAVISGIFEDTLFNQPVIIKIIDYFYYTIGAPESLWTQTDYISSNFGLIQRDLDQTYPAYFLRGALIDSTLFGTVSSIAKWENFEIPNIFSLQQNYPNPFNPTTTIQYNLLIAADAELTIYDLLGRKIETLVNTKQNAGNYRIEFNGSSLSSGIYLYRFNVNNKTILTRKMILLK